jgi:chemotaxis protein MotB
MSAGNIIVIKKKKAGHGGGHHGGAWKVAFADFMTAMMAFFLVMWLISQNQSTKEAIASYFRDPGVFETTAGSLIKGGQNSLDGMPSVDKALFEEAQRKALERAGAKIREEIGKQGGLHGLDKQVSIQLTKEGLRIELLDSEESTFFDSGSSSVKSETERMLGLIATELGRLEMPVIVEGHTDGRPFVGGRAYSNWDLSADRANAARRIMQAAGLNPNQVRSVRGYADRQLRITGAPFDARNRRVSVVVPIENSPAEPADTSPDVKPRLKPEFGQLPPAGSKSGHKP